LGSGREGKFGNGEDGIEGQKKEVTILMDIHTLFILIILQIVTLACLAGVVVVLVNLKGAVDRNASAGWEIEDRLKNLNLTLHEITKRGDIKSVFEGLKENKPKGGEPD